MGSLAKSLLLSVAKAPLKLGWGLVKAPFKIGGGLIKAGVGTAAVLGADEVLADGAVRNTVANTFNSFAPQGAQDVVQSAKEGVVSEWDRFTGNAAQYGNDLAKDGAKVAEVLAMEGSQTAARGWKENLLSRFEEFMIILDSFGENGGMFLEAANWARGVQHNKQDLVAVGELYIEVGTQKQDLVSGDWITVELDGGIIITPKGEEKPNLNNGYIVKMDDPNALAQNSGSVTPDQQEMSFTESAIDFVKTFGEEVGGTYYDHDGDGSKEVHWTNTANIVNKVGYGSIKGLASTAAKLTGEFSDAFYEVAETIGFHNDTKDYDYGNSWAQATGDKIDSLVVKFTGVDLDESAVAKTAGFVAPTLAAGGIASHMSKAAQLGNAPMVSTTARLTIPTTPPSSGAPSITIAP